MRFPVLVLVLSIIPFPAQAYLDPGTGSMILQMVIGGVLVAGYTIKTYWRRIRNFFRSRKRAKP